MTIAQVSVIADQLVHSLCIGIQRYVMYKKGKNQL